VSEGSIAPTAPFLDVPPPFGEFESAAVCILPVPYDATTSYLPGARFGPAALIAASHQVELFDEQLERETYRIGIHTLAPVGPNAAGPEAMIGDVRRECENLLEKGKFIALVGGEHTVALGAIAAHRNWRGNRPFGVVQFDAHRDLRSSYEGSPWSHACVAARILDWDLPLVQLGVRAWSREEHEAAASRGVSALTARPLLEDTWAEALERILEGMPEAIYLSFDLDVLDPSIMPATGTPEPGGLTWQRALELLEWLSLHRKVIGLDMVELSPIPGLAAPNLLAARLLYRAIGFIARHWPAIEE